MKSPDMWTNMTWMLHHDNAPAHVSLLCDFLVKQYATVISYPPYPTVLTPEDFLLTVLYKPTLKGHSCDMREDVKNIYYKIMHDPQNTLTN